MGSDLIEGDLLRAKQSLIEGENFIMRAKVTHNEGECYP
jgi:hypothetical protein